MRTIIVAGKRRKLFVYQQRSTDAM